MKRMTIWLVVATVLASVACKKDSSKAPETGKPVEGPPAVAAPVAEAPKPAPAPAPASPTLPAPKPEDAVTIVRDWLTAIHDNQPESVAAKMTDRVRLAHEEYPSASECSADAMQATGRADVRGVADCAVAVLRDEGKELAKRVSVKGASETAPDSDGLFTMEAANLGPAGATTFVSVSFEDKREGSSSSAIVAVIATPDGPRISGAYVNRMLSDD